MLDAQKQRLSGQGVRHAQCLQHFKAFRGCFKAKVRPCVDKAPFAPKTYSADPYWPCCKDTSKQIGGKCRRYGTSPQVFAEDRVGDLDATMSTEDPMQTLTQENCHLKELLQRMEPGMFDSTASTLAPREQQAELQELHHLHMEQKLALAQQNEQLKWEVRRLNRRVIAARQQHQIAEKGLQKKEEELQQTRKELEASKREAQQMAQVHEEQAKQMAQVHEESLANLRQCEGKLADLQIQNACLKTAEAAARREAESLEAGLRKEINAIKEAGDFQQRVSKDLRKQLDEREGACKRLMHDREQQTQKLADLMLQKANVEHQNDQLQRDCKEAQQARRLLEQHVSELQQQLATLRASCPANAADGGDKSDRLAQAVAEHAEKFGRAAAEQTEKYGRAAAEQAEKLGRAAAEQAEKLGRAAAEQSEKLAAAAEEKARLQSQLQATEKRLSDCHQELNSASFKAKYAEECLSKVHAELQDTRLRACSQLEEAKRQAEADSRRLQRKMQAWQARVEEEEEHALQLLRTEESLRRQREAAFDLERTQLESQVQRLRQEVASIRLRLRNGVQTLVSSPEFVLQVAH